MATSRKKSGGGRSTSQGGRRTAASNSRSKSGSSRGGGRQAPAPTHRPFRREAGAVVCLLLAIFTVLGCFQVKALFIDGLCGLLKGLIGYGFWLVPPALVLSGYVLAFHRGRPVRLRVFCALVLPVLLSCIIHSVSAQALPWDGTLVKSLWDSGEAMTSGGLLSGALAQACVQVFSKVGAAVIFVLVLILAGLGAFNRTIVDVADWFFSRPRYEYEPEEYEPPEPPERQAARPPRPDGRRADIDIPVEDGPLVGKEPPPPPERKKSFFDRRPRVPAPDQVLTGRGEQSESAEAPQPPAPEPCPAPAQPTQPEENVPPSYVTSTAEQPKTFTPQPAPPAERTPVQAPPPEAPTPPVEIVREPAVPRGDKGGRGEAEQAALEVAQHLQAGLEQETPPYQYPPLDLLQEGKGELGGEALVELNANKQRLSDTIHSFGIDASIVNVTRGPSVTRYELELDQGVRLNKLTNLSDDIALALGASGVRIAPIPGQISMVGIEVPNKLVSPVNIRTVLSSREFQDSPSKVSFAVG